MAESRKVVNADGAPEAIGPYSHAVASGGLLFCSGQLALDPDSGEMVGKTAADEAAQCLRNLEAVCAAGGTSLANAVRLTIYTTKLQDFAEINEVYGGFFASDPPARAVVEVAKLPKGGLVEIDAIVTIE